MRSVPHKAVVVLGVDDGAYPRSPVVDGDDVLARRPMLGERDARSEDRQLLLDAVMAASEQFVAIFSGFDERNGRRRPPAVPLQELIVAAARTATAPGDATHAAHGSPAEPGFVRYHPLRAFDERNFRPDGPLPGGTFDKASLEGAKALRTFRANPPQPQVFLNQPLPRQLVTAVTVDELVAFFQNPAREFLRNRLEVTVPRAVDEVNNSLPIAIDGLEKWEIGERVLQQVLDGAALEDALDREVVRGSLPPGSLGQLARSEIATSVGSIASDRGDGEPRSVGIRLDLAPDDDSRPVRVTGVISGISNDTLWVHTYSTISAKHIVAAWVRLLALAVAEPDRVHLARLIGKRGGQQLSSPGPGRAEALLHDLVQVRQSGMRFPMGVPPKTASGFARTYRPAQPGSQSIAVQRALDRVRSTWERDRFAGENDDPWWSLVLGKNSRVEELNRLRALEHFAPRIWDPIHEHGGEA